MLQPEDSKSDTMKDFLKLELASEAGSHGDTGVSRNLLVSEVLKAPQGIGKYNSISVG